MTCGFVIPVPNEGKVVLATGSRILVDNTLQPPVNKLHSLKNGWYAVASGDWAAIQRTAKVLRGTLGGDIPEDLGNTVREACDQLTEEDTLDLILCHSGRIWVIDRYGAISPTVKVAAVGDGADLAIGFLGASKKPKTVEQAKRLARKTLEFVGTRSVCEGPPYRTRAV